MTASTADEALPPSTLYETVTDSRRRAALAELRAADAPVRLADLAAAISKREDERTDADAKIGRIKRIQVELYHVHLPRLADLGLVAFEPADRTVELTDVDRVAKLDPLLDRLE